MRYILLDYAIIRIYIPVRGLAKGLLAYHEQEFKCEYEPVKDCTATSIYKLGWISIYGMASNSVIAAVAEGRIYGKGAAQPLLYHFSEILTIFGNFKI